MYEYQANIRAVLDGDTVRLDLDLGCGVWLRDLTVRLHGIDAPELRAPDPVPGLAAKQFLALLLPMGSQARVRTIKDKREKYGRLLGIFFRGGEATSINDQLVQAGHARPYMLSELPLEGRPCS